MHRVKPFTVTDSQILMNSKKIEYAVANNLLVCKSVPEVVVIDIGNVCNQICRFCNVLKTSRSKKKILLDEGDFAGFEWLRYAKLICLSGFYGDVLANRNFSRILRKIKELAPYSDLKVYTNGLGLSEENIDVILECCSTLHLSVNAISRDVYEKSISGGSYDKHMKNMLLLAEKKNKKRKKLYISTSFVVTKTSEKDVEKFVKFVCNMPFENINLHYGYYWYTPQEKNDKRFFGADEFLENYDSIDAESLKAYCNERGVSFLFRTHEACYSKLICSRPWSHIYIGIVDGCPGMYLCCGGTRPLLITSKFNNFRNIEKIWNHDVIQEIRQNVNSADPSNDMCLYCRRSSVKAANSVKDIAQILQMYKKISYDGRFKFYSPVTID